MNCGALELESQLSLTLDISMAALMVSNCRFSNEPLSCLVLSCLSPLPRTETNISLSRGVGQIFQDIPGLRLTHVLAPPALLLRVEDQLLSLLTESPLQLEVLVRTKLGGQFVVIVLHVLLQT